MSNEFIQIECNDDILDFGDNNYKINKIKQNHH